MADNNSFPQIPKTVWWGVRDLITRRPTVKFDADMLGAQLSVQAAASKQYLTELKRIGILDEEGKATKTALKWRQEGEYKDAVQEIAESTYPDSLLTIAPPGEADRQVVVNWFVNQGLGEGSAKNKAATYLLVTSSDPVNGGTTQPGNASKSTASEPVSRVSRPKKQKSINKESDARNNFNEGLMPLNVNLQLHISADATSDQIEAIFSAMKKYLHND